MALPATERVLTVVGDANDIGTWSSTPYFFLRAGRQKNFLHKGLRLQPSRLRWHRLAWNACRCLIGDSYGGFQYSRPFLHRLYTQDRVTSDHTEIISHFPLLPPAGAGPARVSYYIDATLRQVFFDYGAAAQTAKSMVKEALKREQDAYDRAERIVCFSSYAARAVVEEYGVPASEVHVVPPGANLFDEQLEQPPERTEALGRTDPLRLGFIGKDWRRKGLPFVLELAETLARRGIGVEVVAVGPHARSLPSHPFLRRVGFIDKASEQGRLAELIRSWHFGCLFSSAEAYGISNLECLRLGVPVLARRVGGIPDTVPPGLGFLFEPHAPADEVADLLISFVKAPERYAELRARVAASAPRFSWHRTVERFIALWQGSDAFSYERLVGAHGRHG